MFFASRWRTSFDEVVTWEQTTNYQFQDFVEWTVAEQLVGQDCFKLLT